jgi:hypothetical protein
MVTRPGASAVELRVSAATPNAGGGRAVVRPVVGAMPAVGARLTVAGTARVWVVGGVAYVPPEEHAVGHRGLALRPLDHAEPLRPGDRLCGTA